MDAAKLKLDVVSTCLEEIFSTLERLNKDLDGLKEAIGSETKSSMGDKYETGREMIAYERSKLEDRKAILLRQLSFVQSVDVKRSYRKVEFGALVCCDEDIYFVCVALGVLRVREDKVFAVSPNSPVAQALLGKAAGEEVIFNKKRLLIESIA